MFTSTATDMTLQFGELTTEPQNKVAEPLSPHTNKTNNFTQQDDYGFPEPEDETHKRLQKEWAKKLSDKRSNAKRVWRDFFVNTNRGYSKTIDPNSSSLKSLVRKNEIPSSFRPKVWIECLRVDKLVKENEGYYHKILEVHQNQRCLAHDQIELDLPRTFPHHPYFDTEDSIGRQQMRRILVAFSWRNPFVSYCQSINYIVAILLLHFSEEETFWMLVAIMETLLPANYYNPTLTGLRVDSKVLEEMINDRLPRVAAHLKEHHVDATAFCTGWFMRLFVDVFPIHTTLRIWDLLFNEGAKIMFRVALAFLKMNEREILQQKHMGEILHYLNSAPQKQYDYVTLIKTCFSFYSLTRKDLENLRAKCYKLVQKEIQEMEDRRKAMQEKLQRQREERERLSISLAPTDVEIDPNDEEQQQQQEQQQEEEESHSVITTPPNQETTDGKEEQTPI